MGAVYIATQLSTGRRRALKVMQPDLVNDPAARHMGMFATIEHPEAGSWETLNAPFKMSASEVAVRVAEESVQIHGGYGYIKDYPAEKYWRDSKLCTIGEGTSEIQRTVIARQILRA